MYGLERRLETDSYAEYYLSDKELLHWHLKPMAIITTKTSTIDAEITVLKVNKNLRDDAPSYGCSLYGSANQVTIPGHM